jgi:DNA-binding Xre family transcriptional regulator
MAVSYRPLWISLAERGMKKGDLIETAGLSSSTVAKLGKNERVSLEVIEKISASLRIGIEKIVTVSWEDNPAAINTQSLKR